MPMAACGSLQHIFENQLPESPTTHVESPYSWSKIKSVKPIIDQPSSVTEIFGELHFNDMNSSSSSSSMSSCLAPMVASSSSTSSIADLEPIIINIQEKDKKKSPSSSSSSSSSVSSIEDSFPNLRKINIGRRTSADSFSSLINCTEGLGFESSGDVEDDLSTNDNNQHHIDDYEYDDPQLQEELNTTSTSTLSKDEDYKDTNDDDRKLGLRRSSTSMSGCSSSSSPSPSPSLGASTFPPPISCISKNGKPWVCFKSYRHDGRFILKQIRIPTQEFLHACREDGRLKLHFVHPLPHHPPLFHNNYDHHHDDEAADDNEDEVEGGEEEEEEEQQHQ